MNTLNIIYLTAILICAYKISTYLSQYVYSKYGNEGVKKTNAFILSSFIVFLALTNHTIFATVLLFIFIFTRYAELKIYDKYIKMYKSLLTEIASLYHKGYGQAPKTIEKTKLLCKIWLALPNDKKEELRKWEKEKFPEDWKIKIKIDI